MLHDVSRLWLESAKDDLQHDFAWLDDNDDGSIVLGQLQVSRFIWDSDNQRFSAIGWGFFCLQDLVAN